MKFSVIIPAYNEEQYLPRLLKSIELARSNYSGGRGEIEIIRALDLLLAAYANGFIDRSGHRLVILSSRRFRGGWRLRRRSIVRRGCKVSFRLAPAWPDQRPANNADSAGQGACLYTKVRSIWRLALLLDAGPCLQESDHLELARRKAGGSILV